MNINLELIAGPMDILNPTTQRIMTSVLREVAGAPTIAMLAEIFKMSHVGVWKAIKRLEAKQLIILKRTGTKKNSTYTIHLNWNNPLVEKTLELALEDEATQHTRWIKSFFELEDEVDFLMLYGSILYSPKEANDIDLLSAISRKEGFSKVGRIVSKLQISQLKKIHLINFNLRELKDELKKPNKAFLDAFKKGVVLFGQDKFVQFIKRLT